MTSKRRRQWVEPFHPERIMADLRQPKGGDHCDEPEASDGEPEAPGKRHRQVCARTPPPSWPLLRLLAWDCS